MKEVEVSQKMKATLAFIVLLQALLGLYNMNGWANGNQYSPKQANTWQGKFPFFNQQQDGFVGIAPVGSTSRAESYDPKKPWEGAMHVIKGGSYLCARNYCSRYRPVARESQAPDTGTSHIGFRLVLDPKSTLGNETNQLVKVSSDEDKDVTSTILGDFVRILESNIGGSNNG